MLLLVLERHSGDHLVKKSEKPSQNKTWNSVPWCEGQNVITGSWLFTCKNTLAPDGSITKCAIALFIARYFQTT